MEHPASAVSHRRLRWSGHSDCGKVRKNNEDSFLGLQFDSREVHHLGKFGDASLAESDFVFAVSDGMGGAAAGEFASRITVEKVTRLLPAAFKQAASELNPGYEEILSELFDQIHHALLFLGRSYEECSGMGATLSLCWFTPGAMHFGHVGDSRIYYLPHGQEKLVQVSHDDTHVGWLFRNAKINEREARTHPRRNVLQKALGAGHQFAEPQVGSVRYESGDRFLLCTDGVVDGLYDATLSELVRDAGSGISTKSAPALVKAAVDGSGRDNTTALLIEML